MSKRTATAWALLVVSDQGQADTLPDQRAWAEETARVQGWTLTTIRSGVSSGKLGARGLTLKLIDELESLEPDQRPHRLLMIRLERLGRGDGTEAMEAFLRLRKLGIVIHTRLDGDVSYGRASELLMPVLRLFIGGMENEVRRDKLCTMYARLREARKTDPTVAICMRPPYGLTYDKGRVVPKPIEAAAVKLAFELKVQGYGYHRIARRLTAEAAPMALKSGELRPQRWTADRVARLIKKETYRGTIVDDPTWLRAQRHAKEVRRPTIYLEYPLGGALTCACGYALIGASARRAQGPRCRYYHCRNHDAHGGHMRHHRAEVLEQQFAELLGRLSAEPALLEAFAEAKRTGTSSEALRSQLATIERELRGIDDRRRAVHMAFEDGALARKDVQWRLDDLALRREELRNQSDLVRHELNLVQAARVRLTDLRRLLLGAQAHWFAAEIEDRRALAKAIGNALGGLVVTFDSKLRVGSDDASPMAS